MKMQRLSKTPRITTRGFTIIELLVVISIIALLIAISFPVISVLTSSSRVEAGLNVTGMASDVARQWVQAEAWANDASTDGSSAVEEVYSGTAAIYCPTGEIRIAVNDRNASVNLNSDFLEDRPIARNGYQDIDTIDFIQIPNGVGVAGIVRTGPGVNDVRFIAPPFAIAFNEAGQLNYGDENGYIYYDADGNNQYDLNDDRPAGYNPSEWNDSRDPADMDPNGDANITSTLSLTLPFEAIECVPGIVVYSTAEFAESSNTFDGGGVADLDGAAGQWLRDNGETIFFSPHTGVALRDEGE